MIVGIGVDVVDLERFARSLDRTPHLADRLFSSAEADGRPESLAAVFAAKEAVAKVLGAPGGLAWHDVEVRHEDSGRPYLLITGTVAAAAADRGILRWHLSLSHDAGSAIAMVVAEGDT
ncbi:MAG: holo-ACP synthase [Frankiaceae bacterium]|nr:holo-ACP synthase [Frankiaceae bacterium]MBV9871671.1 holo-ACP synthase [Frankiaceae bacterium]